MSQPQIIQQTTFSVAVNGYARNGYHVADEEIDWDAIITEDDTPVENYDTEQHYALLETTPYAFWSHSVYGKQFIVASDVGIFYEPKTPPIVPDVFLSLGLTKPPAEKRKQHKRYRSYFVWEVHKVPEVVIEIVSNNEGGEDTSKKRKYAELGILYYAIFDPFHELSEETLRFFRLQDGEYVETKDTWMPEVELGLTLWCGRYQEVDTEWLRWSDHNGIPIPTGEELAAQERNRAEQERNRAEQEYDRAEQERNRAERLAAKLLQLGLSADDLKNL